MNSTEQPAFLPSSPPFVSSLLFVQNSPQFLPFVFCCFHTLSLSVSRNFFACHSYENCRVCTNNSHSGTPASSSSKNRLSFFSGTYELPIFYLLCFDIHVSDGGCTPQPNHSSRFVCGTANP